MYGDIVDFIYCKLSGVLLPEKSQRAVSIDQTFGNDAAIMSYVLSSLGHHVDFAMLSSACTSCIEKMKSSGVRFEYPIEGDTGQTILIEDNEGRRTFISRYGTETDMIPGIKGGDFVYIDFYQEKYASVMEILDGIAPQDGIQLYMNLSADNIIEKAKALSDKKRKIDYIQFSCGLYDSDYIFEELHELLKESILIGTCAEKGAIMYISGQKHHFGIPGCHKKNILGAGAFFAAFIIDGLGKNMKPVEAHRYAVENVSRLCTECDGILMEYYETTSRDCL